MEINVAIYRNTQFRVYHQASAFTAPSHLGWFNGIDSPQTQVEWKMVVFCAFGKTKECLILTLMSCTLHYSESSFLLFFFPCLILTLFALLLPFKSFYLSYFHSLHKCLCQKMCIEVLAPPFPSLSLSLSLHYSYCYTSIEHFLALFSISLISLSPPSPYALSNPTFLQLFLLQCSSHHLSLLILSPAA